MTSQVSQYGDMALVNALSGAQNLTYGSTLSTWNPGDVFYSSANNAFQTWNGSAWVNTGVVNGVIGPQQRYLALLTADPVAGGAVNISDTAFVECSTAGYARQQIFFGEASTGYPSSAANNSVLTFTMTSTMTVPVQWAALVTVGSGSSGLFLASWLLAQAYMVDASQNIQVGIGQLTLQGN